MGSHVPIPDGFGQVPIPDGFGAPAAQAAFKAPPKSKPPPPKAPGPTPAWPDETQTNRILDSLHVCTLAATESRTYNHATQEAIDTLQEQVGRLLVQVGGMMSSREQSTDAIRASLATLTDSVRLSNQATHANAAALEHAADQLITQTMLCTRTDATVQTLVGELADLTQTVDELRAAVALLGPHAQNQPNQQQQQQQQQHAAAPPGHPAPGPVQQPQNLLPANMQQQQPQYGPVPQQQPPYGPPVAVQQQPQYNQPVAMQPPYGPPAPMQQQQPAYGQPQHGQQQPQHGQPANTQHQQQHQQQPQYVQPAAMPPHQLPPYAQHALTGPPQPQMQPAYPQQPQQGYPYAPPPAHAVAQPPHLQLPWDPQQPGPAALPPAPAYMQQQQHPPNMADLTVVPAAGEQLPGHLQVIDGIHYTHVHAIWDPDTCLMMRTHVVMARRVWGIPRHLAEHGTQLVLGMGPYGMGLVGEFPNLRHAATWLDGVNPRLRNYWPNADVINWHEFPLFVPDDPAHCSPQQFPLLHAAILNAWTQSYDCSSETTDLSTKNFQGPPLCQMQSTPDHGWVKKCCVCSGNKQVTEGHFRGKDHQWAIKNYTDSPQGWNDWLFKLNQGHFNFHKYDKWNPASGLPADRAILWHLIGR